MEQMTDRRTAYVVPPEALTLEGIPPIPVSVAEAVSRYTEFRSASLEDWHPTRREMLITTRFANVPQVHSVRFPGGDRRQLTFFADGVRAAQFHPSRGNVVVVERDVGGDELTQIYRLDLATGDATLLTDGVSRNEIGPWSRDGTRMAYRSTRRNGTAADIYTLDPSDPTTDRLILAVDGGAWWLPLDWSPDDKMLLVCEYVSANESHLWLLEVDTGSKVRLTPAESCAYFWAQFSADGKGVYATSDRQSEFAQIIYIDVATKVLRPIGHETQWDVEAIALSHDGKTLAYVSNQDGISVLRLLDTVSGAALDVDGVPIGVITNLRWHRNNRELGFTIDSARSPRDVYSLDTTSRSIDRWTESETGGIDPTRFSEPALVHWHGRDGLQLAGFLYMPSAAFGGPRPVIVGVHGGPEDQSRPGFVGWLNYFLERGVALLRPNIRGSTGFGKTFLAADNGLKRVEAYHDIGALLDWIGSQPNLDPRRVIITGGSYGGHVTLVSAMLYGERISGALAVAGIANLVTFLERTESYRRDLRRAEYGDEREATVRAFMEEMAPLNHAERINKPLFVVTGANDPRVPKTEADQIVTAVRRHGAPVWYLVAADEGHGFVKKQNQDYLMSATVAFVERFLLEDAQS